MEASSHYHYDGSMYVCCVGDGAGGSSLVPIVAGVIFAVVTVAIVFALFLILIR